MRVLVQRSNFGSVTVGDSVTGAIQTGFVLLVGIGQGDDETIVKKMAEKVAHLRIFNNDEGKFSKSLLDVQGGALVVSQFTLYGEMKRGRRPSFSKAAAPAMAEQLITSFIEALQNCGVQKVEAGIFGAHMLVELCNDGPVTIWLDSDELFG